METKSGEKFLLPDRLLWQLDFGVHVVKNGGLVRGPAGILWVAPVKHKRVERVNMGKAREAGGGTGFCKDF